MRLSDMLKRKRVSKQRSTNNSRKGRHSTGSLAGATDDASTHATSTSSAAAAAAVAAGFDMPTLVHHQPATAAHHHSGPSPDGSSATPSRRSKFADRTSSLLSQLHPGRWVRGHHDNSSNSPPMMSSRKDSASPTLASTASSLAASLKNSGSATAGLLSHPATMAHSREKAKRWVREQASRFLESYFKESLGSRHPALTILRRLSAQVDHLTRKPKDGER